MESRPWGKASSSGQDRAALRRRWDTLLLCLGSRPLLRGQAALGTAVNQPRSPIQVLSCSGRSKIARARRGYFRAGLADSGAGRAGLRSPRPSPSVDRSVVTPLATVATSRLRVLPGTPGRLPFTAPFPGCHVSRKSRPGATGRCPCPAGVPGATAGLPPSFLIILIPLPGSAREMGPTLSRHLLPINKHQSNSSYCLIINNLINT